MENNTILVEKTTMKTPVTLNVTIEAKQLYAKLKGLPDFSLSDLVDKLIKEEAKKRKITA